MKRNIWILYKVSCIFNAYAFTSQSQLRMSDRTNYTYVNMPGGWRIGRDGRRERTPPWVAVVLPPSVLDNPGGLEAVPGGWLDTRIWSTRPSRVEPVGVPYVQWGVQFHHNTFNFDGNETYERRSSVFLFNTANCDIVDECSPQNATAAHTT